MTPVFRGIPPASTPRRLEPFTPQFNLRGNSIPAGYGNPAQHVDNFTNDGDEDEDMHEDNGIQELEYFCLVLSSQALLTRPSPVTAIYLHLPL
jgi:hypothetical protein